MSDYAFGLTEPQYKEFEIAMAESGIHHDEWCDVVHVWKEQNGLEAIE